ncbi:MAG: hypothetical protein HC897_13415, partial [Thermoanaerobaculia bacterium]|nr:hypothetical protein [Thermoanaerobaculia bacterium]
ELLAAGLRFVDPLSGERVELESRQRLELADARSGGSTVVEKERRPA